MYMNSSHACACVHMRVYMYMCVCVCVYVYMIVSLRNKQRHMKETSDYFINIIFSGFEHRPSEDFHTNYI